MYLFCKSLHLNYQVYFVGFSRIVEIDKKQVGQKEIGKDLKRIWVRLEPGLLG